MICSAASADSLNELAELLATSMPLEEDVVLPAAHAQQDFAQQRDMMPVFRIDRDLSRCTERDLIAGDVIRDVDDGQCPAAGCPLSEIHERSCRLDLAGRDRVQDEAHLAPEHATGDGVEGGLGLIAGLDPLQGILLERCAECLVLYIGV